MIRFRLLWIVVVLFTATQPVRISEKTVLLPTELFERLPTKLLEVQICRYLCFLGSLTAHLCRCKGKVCKEGSVCRIINGTIKPQALCCPVFPKQIQTFCDFVFKFGEKTNNTIYFGFNPKTGGCESGLRLKERALISTAPKFNKYTTCTACSLYKLCTETEFLFMGL